MTVKWKKVPFFGDGVYAGLKVVTRQRRLNCYYQVRKDQDRTSVTVLPTPGMSLAMTVPAAVSQTPRGILANPNALYTAIGSQFLSLAAPDTAGGAASVLATGNLNSQSGPMTFAANPTQIGMVDGKNLYFYVPSTGQFSVCTSAGVPNGAQTLTVLNGFAIAELPGTNQFFVSSFNDLSTWNALSFGEASQYNDTILAVDQLGGLLIPFSTTHLEFWQNSGLTTEPFTYIQNTATEYGLAAVFSRVHVADSIVFLAQTLEGGLQFARIQGYQAKPISTPDIDKIIQSFSTYNDCEALAYQTAEAKFAQFTFPTMNRSFLWNATTDMWSETQTGVTSGYAARHIGRWSAVYQGKTLITDYNAPNIYNPVVGLYTDNGNTIVREVVTRCAVNDQNYFRVGGIYFDMDTGVGLTSPLAQGYNPMIMLQVSRDTRAWGPEQWIALGKTGQSRTRVTRRRCGRARFFYARLRLTDPVNFVINGGAAMVSSPSGRPR
jgi:hypothetical protein